MCLIDESCRYELVLMHLFLFLPFAALTKTIQGLLISLVLPKQSVSNFAAPVHRKTGVMFHFAFCLSSDKPALSSEESGGKQRRRIKGPFVFQPSRMIDINERWTGAHEYRGTLLLIGERELWNNHPCYYLGKQIFHPLILSRESREITDNRHEIRFDDDDDARPLTERKSTRLSSDEEMAHLSQRIEIYWSAHLSFHILRDVSL